MSAVWIALGTVGTALIPVAISLNAAKTAKRRKDRNTPTARDTERSDPDSDDEDGP